MWVSGTQHMPFSEGQWKENGGKWGWRNFTNTSWFSGSTEVTVSLQKLKNLTGFRIWLFIGHWRLALAASLLRVPPMPLQIAKLSYKNAWLIYWDAKPESQRNLWPVLFTNSARSVILHCLNIMVCIIILSIAPINVKFLK